MRKSQSRKEQRKRKLKREKQLLALRKSGKASKGLNQKELNNAYLEVIAEKKKERKRKVRNEKRKLAKYKRLSKKKALLWDKYGIDVSVYGDAKIDKITFSEIEKGDFSRHKWLQFHVEFFDFHRTLYVRNGQGIMIAFRDFLGDRSFSDIYKKSLELNDNELLGIIKENMQISLSNELKGVGSDGEAGDCIIRAGNGESLKVYRLEDIVKVNRRKKTKQLAQVKSNAGFQTLKFKGRTYFTEITAHNFLAIIASVMSNVTARSRVDFYKHCYKQCEKLLPEMLEILPKP